MGLSRHLVNRVQLAHVKQLVQFKLDVGVPRGEPPSEDLLEWIKDNPKAIQAAKSSQCVSASPDSPNWDAVFFSLVESRALSLRKEESILQAIDAAKKGDFERAQSYLQDSQKDIDEVAKALDCTFVQLCDFVDKDYDDRPGQGGAYCGLFVSNSTDGPFMGLTYKGTDSVSELNTDLDWEPILPGEIAFGAMIHQGFYHGLFGTFTSSTGTEAQVPFDLMLDQLATIYAQHTNAILHFTGHSLGGAYSTLTYAEFLRRGLAADYKFADIYTFGAPRVCEEPFAAEVGKRTNAGSGNYVFRIVNNQDPIPTVPPTTKKELETYPFVHVDRGWHIFPSSGPQTIDSEQPPNRPVDPQGVFSIIANLAEHGGQNYYKGWLNTPHS